MARCSSPATLTLLLCIVLSAATPTSARAQLSVEEERAVQIAAMSTGYAFGALHAGLSVLSVARGERLEHSWIAGSFLSSISLVGFSIGYITQAAAFTSDPDVAAAYAISSPPGILLGSMNLGFAIDAIVNGDGGFWMEPEPAGVTLIHGLSLSTFGWVLALLPNPAIGDLENIVPIYTWALAGALVAIYSVVSLIVGSD